MNLSAIKVAVLVANGFEQSEFETPIRALISVHSILDVISINRGNVKGWKEKNWGNEYVVNKTVYDVKADDYDALLLPGGFINTDTLRLNKNAIAFVNGFCEDKKVIAATCHGPWSLIDTGFVKGKKLTSILSIKTALVKAGANWINDRVVVDKGLVTSGRRSDLPVFCEKMIEEIAAVCMRAKFNKIIGS